MQTKKHVVSDKERKDVKQTRPDLKIRKIGIVARDYNKTKDFKASLPEVLRLLDKRGCDAVLFSLFSLKPGHDPREAFKGLKNIKAVFVEEFAEKKGAEKTIRERKQFVIYYRTPSGWKEYRLTQRFATLTGTSQKIIHDFVKDEMPKRFLGNCCVLLCGESTVIKKVKDNCDVYNIRRIIPQEVEIILNPCHDCMKRPIMYDKREYLSQNNRWVISVWCKGRPGERIIPWTIYHNGKAYNAHHPDETIDKFRDDNIFIGIINVDH